MTIRARILCLLIVLGCGGDPTQPSQPLTVGSYTLAYHGVWSYRGTMRVASITPDDVVVSFDVLRDDLPRIHFETGQESYPLISNTTHGRPSYFLTPALKEDGCGGLGCIVGGLIIHLATTADTGNFCAFGTKPNGLRASDCVILVVR